MVLISRWVTFPARASSSSGTDHRSKREGCIRVATVNGNQETGELQTEMKILSSLFSVIFAAFSLRTAAAFTSQHRQQAVYKRNVFVRASGLPIGRNQKEDYALADEEVNPLLRFGEGEKEKVVNGFGLWCAAVSIFTGPIWSAAMSLLNAMNNISDDFDPDRSLYDKTGKIWAKTWLTMTDSYPTFSGDIERLKSGQGPCLYVANHASWLDIPVICTVLDPVFKFIAKGELRSVPCIGQQLAGGNHILIDRDDKRSQLRTFKDGIGWLKKGVPIMAFPEGMRSRDGRLMDFKGGLFVMAVKCKVPIVPITLSHTHAIMPSNSYFPVQNGNGKLHVHVHEAIDTEGKSDDELSESVRKAFLSTLPFTQHPQSSVDNEQTVQEAREVDKVA